MVILRWKKIIFFVIISSTLNVNGFQIKEKKRYNIEGNLTVRGLQKAIMYIQNNPQTLVEDVIFGLYIVKANLKWIFIRFKELPMRNHYIWPQEVKKLMRNCNDLIKSSIVRDHYIHDKKSWMNEAEDLKKGVLKVEKEVFVLPKFDSCQSIDEYMMNGSPYDSDFCINELFSKNCNISDYCWLSELNDDPHSGYKTSHRLLYLQMATKLQCGIKNPEKFSEIKKEKINLCQQMLLEARSLHEDTNFFLTRDLFLEQIGLCGFEGHEEFAAEDWRKEIRNWQSDNGCFGEDMKFEKCSMNVSYTGSKKRIKRTDFTIDKCHTHVTAVAMSAMAFHLRVILNSLLFQ